MRPNLHLLTDRRARRQRGARHALKSRAQSTLTPTAKQAEAVRDLLAGAHTLDVAAQRVREAGGPLDQASYTCQCGYVFAAPVSTTVACPNCGTAQAW